MKKGQSRVSFILAYSAFLFAVLFMIGLPGSPAFSLVMRGGGNENVSAGTGIGDTIALPSDCQRTHTDPFGYSYCILPSDGEELISPDMLGARAYGGVLGITEPFWLKDEYIVEDAPPSGIYAWYVDHFPVSDSCKSDFNTPDGESYRLMNCGKPSGVIVNETDGSWEVRVEYWRDSKTIWYGVDRITTYVTVPKGQPGVYEFEEEIAAPEPPECDATGALGLITCAGGRIGYFFRLMFIFPTAGVVGTLLFSPLIVTGLWVILEWLRGA